MNEEELLEILNEKYKLYSAYEKQMDSESRNNDYWRGKASGILLAIEIIQGKLA